MPGRQILDAIGGTPLVVLKRVAPPDAATIVAKLEFANPTGSMKDRMARAAIEAAAADGRLPPGGTVVEYTAGTTGISLAFVCAALGYGLEIVFSDAFSDEKRVTMQTFGARITDISSDNKRITEALIRKMIATAGRLSQQPGHWWCDQLNNHDAISGYVPLGEEIWRQTLATSTPSSTRSAPPTRSTARATSCGITTRRCTSPRSNPLSRRCSPGG